MKVCIRRTVNNLFISLIRKRLKPKPIWRLLQTFSNGKSGFKHARRDTPFASETVGQQAGSYISEKKFRCVDIELKSPIDIHIRAALKGLAAGAPRLRIRYFRQCTPVAHNGCRPKKVRRV